MKYTPYCRLYEVFLVTFTKTVVLTVLSNVVLSVV